MGKFIDLTGQKFGRLIVVERDTSKPKGHQKPVFWICKCECGTVTSVTTQHLITNHTNSCGCSHGQNHGLRYTAIYNTWGHIKARCFNPKSKDYSIYGGRGITMFPAWIHDFQAFYNYVTQLPNFGKKGYTLDRINNGGNYEPDNLRWATATEQARNRRTNITIEYQGQKMTLVEISKITGINWDTLRKRIRKGDTGERLFRPVRKHK